uniref:WD repeat-containing protein 44 n=1 Tax=Parastrongyloides trichosuri TaxID=131310 RepID=A0A0N4Z642_PARTI
MDSTTPTSPEYLDATDEISSLRQFNFPSLNPTVNVIDKGDPIILNSINRRQRLNVLRNKMKNEFGQSSMFSGITTPSVGGDEETLSISESASLASWGRNLLSESSNSFNRNVFPLDSISTRGISTFGTNNSNIVSPTRSYIERMNLNCMEISSKNNATYSDNINDPIPEEAAISSSPIQRQLSRKDSEKQTDVSLDSSDNYYDVEEDCDKISEMRGKVLDNSDSKESIATNAENEYGKRRGHVKTNSLDRGLSLAKVMKTGPFPPPDQKANSLNRQYSPSEIYKVMCEEDQLNDQAAGVVSEITFDILKTEKSNEGSGFWSENSTNDSSEFGDNISKHPPPIPDRSHLPVLEKKPAIPPRPPKVVVSNQVKEKSLPSVEVKESVGKDETEVEYKTCNEESILDIYDPITRDVERRMSMKEHTPVSSKSSTGDKNMILPATTQHTLASGLNTIKGAKNTMKNLSHGLFRGVIDKAKSAVFHGRGSHKSKNDFEEMHDTEDDLNIDERPSSVVSHLTEPVSQLQSSTPVQICRPKNSKKGPFDFTDVKFVQQINNEHSGAIWVVKFSICGKLIATAGKDAIVRVWCLKDYVDEFENMKSRYCSATGRNSASGSNYEVMLGLNSRMNNSSSTVNEVNNLTDDDNSVITSSNSSETKKKQPKPDSDNEIISPKPLCVYRGHTSDIVDISWSKNYFILSSGNDKTVKLWHLSRNECLCCFQHMDFVTGVAFMPKDDRYFISGSMDGKVRLWHIPEKKVVLWNEVEGSKFITAVTFVKNGKFAVVGTYIGQCFFFTTDHLKYYTMIDVRSTKGKNAVGHKITGLSVSGDKLLVTSNDSRIRIYDIRDMKLTCKFIGSTNDHSHIRASFSPDGKHIICGSEDRHIYIWKTCDSTSAITVRKDRNTMWERIRGHENIVSVAIFAPKPNLFINSISKYDKFNIKTFSEHNNSVPTNGNIETINGTETELDASSCYQPIFKNPLPLTPNETPSSASIVNKEKVISGDVIISADFNGCLKIFVNPPRVVTTSNNFFSNE